MLYKQKLRTPSLCSILKFKTKLMTMLMKNKLIKKSLITTIICLSTGNTAHASNLYDDFDSKINLPSITHMSPSFYRLTKLYVANADSASVTEIMNGAVTKTIPVGSGPYSLTVLYWETKEIEHMENNLKLFRKNKRLTDANFYFNSK